MIHSIAQLLSRKTDSLGIPLLRYERRLIKRLIRRTDGMTSFDELALLYQLAKQTRNGCIVEVGSYRGRSTAAVGCGSLNGHQMPVFAVEPHEEFVGALGGRFGPADRAAFFRCMLDTGCYRIVRLVNLSSEVVTSGWNLPVGLLWIDGDHSYQGVRRDYECWRSHLTSDALVLFDDSRDPSIGPARLIEELVQAGELVPKRVVRKITVLKREARGRRQCA